MVLAAQMLTNAVFLSFLALSLYSSLSDALYLSGFPLRPPNLTL